MRELIQHWWLVLCRALLAFALAWFAAAGIQMEGRLVFQPLASPLIIAVLGLYVIADSILLFLLVWRLKDRLSNLALFQSLTNFFIGVGLLTAFYDRADWRWFVGLAVAQAASTGVYELLAATHLQNHIEDKFAIRGSGLLALFFAVVLAAMYWYDLQSAVYWVTAYAFGYGLMLLGCAYRLRELQHRYRRSSSLGHGVAQS